MTNVYIKAFLIIAGSHVVRWGAEYVYYTQCAGFWSSIFAWNSPTCRGLRWVSDSVGMNALSVITGYSMKLLKWH